MSKSKSYSNIQNVEDPFDGHPYDPSNASSPRREDTDGTFHGEPLVGSSLSSKVPGITTSPRGDSIRMDSPISPGSDIARSITMPDSLSKFRKAAQTAIQARRMSSKLAYCQHKTDLFFLYHRCKNRSSATTQAQHIGKRRRARSTDLLTCPYDGEHSLPFVRICPA